MSVWLFQGNPDSFDIDSYLSDRQDINWTVRQESLAERMSPGDLVYIWRAKGSSGDGELAGVVASAVIRSRPDVYPEDPDALRYWKTEGGGPALRVRLRLIKVAKTKERLKREWLKHDPVLAGLRIFKQPVSTNFPVDDRHAERLARLWANAGRDWDRSDSVAGLWAYDQTFEGPVSTTAGSVVSNVALLIGRSVQGVHSKTRNFRFLDPRGGGSGLSGGGENDRLVWEEFFDTLTGELKSDLLDDEFRLLWTQHQIPAGTPEAARPAFIEFGEAPNDDPAELQKYVRAVRRGQPAFRRNLLRAYERRCCISGWAPEVVLEAAHILEHATSGLNSMSNGLLLRADIHALFDEGLLRVDADALRVELDPRLRDTPYWELHGRELRAPVDGQGPSRDLLRARNAALKGTTVAP